METKTDENEKKTNETDAYEDETLLEMERSDFIHNMGVLSAETDKLKTDLSEIMDTARFKITEMCDKAEENKYWTKTFVDAVFTVRADMGCIIPDIYTCIERIHEIVTQYHEIIHVAKLMETRPEDYNWGDDWEVLGRDIGLMNKYGNHEWVKEVFLKHTCIRKGEA